MNCKGVRGCWGNLLQVQWGNGSFRKANNCVQSLQHKAKKQRVRVQRRGLKGLERRHRDNGGKRRKVGGDRGQRGHVTTGEWQGQQYLFLVLVANRRKKRQKFCRPCDSACQKNEERLGQKCRGG
jgi:hypothetical protein